MYWDLLILSRFLKSEKIPAMLYVGKGPEYRPFSYTKALLLSPYLLFDRTILTSCVVLPLFFTSPSLAGRNLANFFFKKMKNKHENFVISRDVFAIFGNKIIKLATSKPRHFPSSPFVAALL
jgi:hypothetical protein